MAAAVTDLHCRCAPAERCRGGCEYLCSRLRIRKEARGHVARRIELFVKQAATTATAAPNRAGGGK